MDLEIAQTRGILADRRQRAAELKLKIEGLRDAVRSTLPQFVPVERIRGDVAAQLALELAELLVEYKAVLEEITAINRALGR